MKLFSKKNLIIISLLIGILLFHMLVFFHDYISKKYDEETNTSYIKYNNCKYNYVDNYGSNIKFIGKQHKVGKTFIMFMPQSLYCLDSDVEENIIFTNIGGSNEFKHIWVKEGYEFINKEMIIDLIQIKDIENKEYINLAIENCCFNDICIEANNFDYYEISKCPMAFVKFLYNDCIEYYVYAYQGYNKKLYIQLYDHNDNERWFIVKDEYIETFEIVTFE